MSAKSLFWKKSVPLLAGAVMLCGTLAQADEVAVTPPVGCWRLEAPGGSTSLLSAPLLRPAVFAGRVSGVSAHGVSVAGANFALNAFTPNAQESYYAEITTGALAGVTLPIVSNSAAQLAFRPEGPSLTQHPLGAIQADVYNSQLTLVTPGDTIVIRPHWSVGTLLGRADGDLAIAPFATQQEAEGLSAGDRVLFPDESASGFEQPAGAELFYVQGVGWRRKGAATDQSGYALEPGKAALLSRSGSAPVVVLAPGDVPMNRAVTWIPNADAAAGREVYFGLRLAEPISIQNAGLWNSDQALRIVQTSASRLARADELQVLGPQQGDSEFEPSQSWIVVSEQGWKEVGDRAADVQLQPGAGYRLRLRAGSPGGWWLQVPNY